MFVKKIDRVITTPQWCYILALDHHNMMIFIVLTKHQIRKNDMEQNDIVQRCSKLLRKSEISRNKFKDGNVVDTYILLVCPNVVFV